MTLKEFVRQHRQELTEAIEKSLNHVPKTASCDCPLSRTEHDHHHDHKLTMSDLEGWVNNDEGLYLWARSEGVRI